MTFPRLSTRMPSLLCLLLVGALLGFGGVRAEAKTHKAKKNSTPSESPTPSDKETAAQKKGLDLPIPIDHSAQGVVFPIWTDGKLQMRYNMEVAFRVDADNLRLTQLKLETFDDNGKPEMVVEMPESMLNLQTRVLTSEQPVTVRRDDLEIVGKNMTFDTQTRQGKFVGPVRVLIYQQDDDDAPKSSTPAPAPTAVAHPTSSPISE